MMLQNVGRYADAAAEAGRGVDMLALDPDTQFALADSLNVVGKREEAKQHFDAYIDLNADSVLAKDALAVREATETGDYAAGMTALANPKLPMSAEQKAALLAAFRAMDSGNAVAKTQAVKALSALPDDQKSQRVIRTLAALGASHEALRLFVAGLDSRYRMAFAALVPEHARRAQRTGLPGDRRTPRPDALLANDPHQARRLLGQGPAALLPDDLTRISRVPTPILLKRALTGCGPSR